MIFTREHYRGDVELSADVCVIGSGAGGAPVAEELARHGKRVVVLEAGSFLGPEKFTQLEHEMFPRLYHDKAGRTTKDRAIHVHQGKGVGGSTLHNLNLCARMPNEVWADWNARFGLSALSWEVLSALYDEVEVRLSVTRISEANLNANNRILKDACEKLGYRGGYLRHNRVGCAGTGFCELGCPLDTKQNARKIYIPSAVNLGATILADTWATRIRWEGRRVTGVEAFVRDEAGRLMHRVTIDARAVCVAASATGTPALLQNSEIPDPGRLVGSRLSLHPGAAVAGIFDKKLKSWMGIPQSYECTEFLDFGPRSNRRAWIVPSFAHPVGVSAILGGFGEEHEMLLADYPRMAALSTMVHDQSVGRVRSHGCFGVEIDYELSADDARQLALGLKESSRLLLARGARKVVVPFTQRMELTNRSEVDKRWENVIVKPKDLNVTSVHPMASCWIGDNAGASCVDSRGRYHHLDNLFVADSSLFPSSLGVPPQLTTYALGVHVGRSMLGLLP